MLSQLGVLLLSLLPFACSDDGPIDEGSDEACAILGSAIEGVPFYEPPKRMRNPHCAESWASDAPLRDPVWTQLVDGDHESRYPSAITATPSSGVVVALGSELLWFGPDGSPGPVVEHGMDVQWHAQMFVRQSDGHLLLLGYPADQLVIREYDESGVRLGDTVIAVERENLDSLTLLPYGDELIVAGFGEDPADYDYTKMFFLRVDADGQVLLRHELLDFTHHVFAALDDEGHLLFGSTAQVFIIDPRDGTVLANSVTTSEFFRVVAGGPSGFAFVGTFYEADTKIWLTQLSGLGVEQWSRTHGRLDINGNDEGYGVAALADGWVAVGTETLWWTSETEPFLGVNNPWLVRSDDEGNALWAARFSVPGAAVVVTATNDGGVVAAGLVSVDGQTWESIHSALWLARWDD